MNYKTRIHSDAGCYNTKVATYYYLFEAGYIFSKCQYIAGLAQWDYKQGRVRLPRTRRVDTTLGLLTYL